MKDGPRELALPQWMRGPFLREYDPAGGFRHPGAQVASVLFYGKGAYSVVTAMRTEHVRKRPLAKPFTVVEIARGEHVTSLALKPDAEGGAAAFDAEIDIHWEAVDFFLAADKRLTDVGESLRSQIQQRLLQVTRRFPVSDAQGANYAIEAEQEAGRWDDLGREAGLRVRLFVRLAPDAKAKEYADQERDREAEKTAARHSHEMDLLKERHRADLLQVRMSFIRRMAETGQWDEVAFRLADDPENASAFLEVLRQEARADRRELLDHTMRLVEEGVIQSPEVEGQIRTILGGGILPGTTPTGLVQRPEPPRQALPAGPPVLPPAPPYPPGPAPSALRAAPGVPPVPSAPFVPSVPLDPPVRPGGVPHATPSARHTGTGPGPDDRPRRRPSDSFDDWDVVSGPGGGRGHEDGAS